MFLLSSRSLCQFFLYKSSIYSSTVWFRTIFFALSTLRKIPFSSITKFALKPEYMLRLSISFLCLMLKNFPVLPISEYPASLMTVLNLLLRKKRRVLGSFLASMVLTFLTETLYSLTWNSAVSYFGSLLLMRFMPQMAGLGIKFCMSFQHAWRISFRFCLLSLGIMGSNLTEKMKREEMSLVILTSKWLERMSTDRKLSVQEPLTRLGSWASCWRGFSISMEGGV